jgi:DNA-binding response OmpR family regulator
MEGKLLIVDDEQAIREIICRYLKRFGYECDMAGDADIAIEMIKTQDYDIIITDKNMPGAGSKDEGGLALISFVREYDPRMVVIIMTGYASIESAVASMKLGAFDYITKPFDIDGLKRKVDRIREYQNFLNPEGILEMYRTLHNQILDVFEEGHLCNNEQRHQYLQTIDGKFDYIFRIFRNWELIICDQRERLAKIAFSAEQLRDTMPATDPSYPLIENVLKEASGRL